MTDPITLPELPDGSLVGPNLELDAMFGEMERAAQGKPEVQYGNAIEPAVPPDWKETAAQATALLQRTRDLRVMTHLAIARLHLEGLPAFAQELAVIRCHLDTLWQPVHPQLDPEDDNDPLQRRNALMMLGDPVRVLRPLRDLPLAGTVRAGQVSWRDIAILNGQIEAEPGRAKLSEAMIRAAFAGTDSTQRAALGAGLEQALDDIVAIPAVFDRESQPASGPDFTDLIKLLQDIQKVVSRYETLAAAAAEPEPAAEDGPPAGEAAAPETVARTAPRVVAIRSIAVLHSREDALHALELAAAYYRTNEPSSPLPLLIDRAKRLAVLPFLEILRDLAPDGLLQAQTVVGTVQDEQH